MGCFFFYCGFVIFFNFFFFFFFFFKETRTVSLTLTVWWPGGRERAGGTHEHFITAPGSHWGGGGGCIRGRIRGKKWKNRTVTMRYEGQKYSAQLSTATSGGNASREAAQVARSLRLPFNRWKISSRFLVTFLHPSYSYKHNQHFS